MTNGNNSLDDRDLNVAQLNPYSEFDLRIAHNSSLEHHAGASWRRIRGELYGAQRQIHSVAGSSTFVQWPVKVEPLLTVCRDEFFFFIINFPLRSLINREFRPGR